MASVWKERTTCDFSPSTLGSRDQAQFVRLGGKHLYLLGHPSRPDNLVFTWKKTEEGAETATTVVVLGKAKTNLQDLD